MRKGKGLILLLLVVLALVCSCSDNAMASLCIHIDDSLQSKALYPDADPDWFAAATKYRISVFQSEGLTVTGYASFTGKTVFSYQDIDAGGSTDLTIHLPAGYYYILVEGYTGTYSKSGVVSAGFTAQRTLVSASCSVSITTSPSTLGNGSFYFILGYDGTGICSISSAKLVNANTGNEIALVAYHNNPLRWGTYTVNYTNAVPVSSNFNSTVPAGTYFLDVTYGVSVSGGEYSYSSNDILVYVENGKATYGSLTVRVTGNESSVVSSTLGSPLALALTAVKGTDPVSSGDTVAATDSITLKMGSSGDAELTYIWKVSRDGTVSSLGNDAFSLTRTFSTAGNWRVYCYVYKSGEGFTSASGFFDLVVE